MIFSLKNCLWCGEGTQLKLFEHSVDFTLEIQYVEAFMRKWNIEHSCISWHVFIEIFVFTERLSHHKIKSCLWLSRLFILFFQGHLNFPSCLKQTKKSSCHSFQASPFSLSKYFLSPGNGNKSAEFLCFHLRNVNLPCSFSSLFLSYNK